MYPSVGRYAAPSTPSRTSGGRAPQPRRARAARAAGRRSLPTPPDARSPPSAPATRRDAATRPPPASLRPDLALERAVEIDALHHHPGQRERQAQLPPRDPRSGTSSRSSGRPARRGRRRPQPGEPVEDRAPADAPADHHRARARAASSVRLREPWFLGPGCAPARVPPGVRLQSDTLLLGAHRGRCPTGRSPARTQPLPGLSVDGSPCRGGRRERRLPLRRARDATRTKLSREAVRGSGRSAGEVDESAPGSANPWSHPCRAHEALRKYGCKEKFAKSGNMVPEPLDEAVSSPSVPGAPRTERPRLMALRQAVASAAVSRGAGRRSTGPRCIFVGIRFGRLTSAESGSDT